MIVVKEDADGEPLLPAVFTGLCVGSLMGFIDTYGYAVTGYTTSELSPVIAAVLTLILYRTLFRRVPTPLNHVIAVSIATGISLSTAITSGMYITYTMLGHVSIPSAIDLPKWMFFTGHYSFNSLIFYMFATAVSASGVVLAYVFYKHFIEREKLPFPIGMAASSMIKLAAFLKMRKAYVPLLAGAVAQVLVMALNNPSLDPTPALQSMLPGAAFAISANVLIFLLALLVPLNTSVGVGIGNMLMYLVLTPAFASSGMLISSPLMGADEVAVAAAPLTASVIVGFLVIAVIYYLMASRKLLASTARFIRSSRYLTRYLIAALALMAMPALAAWMLGGLSKIFIIISPAYIALQFLLVLVTLRVVGEAGTASQSTLPLATLSLYASGLRGAEPYALLDPYTGVPMPQFVAGVTMNLIKMGRSAGTYAEIPVSWLGIALLAGAPITFTYGFCLLKIFGLSSPKLNLLRWVPVVMWMKGIYSGSMAAFPLQAVIAGAAVAAIAITLFKLTRLAGISLFAILLGITLTPDIGILFLVAAVVKYLALRVGPDVYETLIYNASLALAGAGIGVAASVALSAAGAV